MFSSIVVPVDLSEIDIAQPALDRAVALAAMTNASIHLVYVRSILPVTLWNMSRLLLTKSSRRIVKSG